MPRKRASASSPEKPVATPRRNTRRGRNEEPEEVAAVEVEIPRHLLRGSDESSEEEDNDSDYGSPKKGRGRGKAATGRGRKAKVESPAGEKPAARPRRGRRAKNASPERVAEEGDNSQSTQETGETTTENEAAESEPTPHAETSDIFAQHENTSSTSITSEPVTHEIEAEKVSEVTIEQDLQSNTDQAPVNEEENDGSNEIVEVESGRDDELASREVVDEKMYSPPPAEPVQVVEVAEEESKDAPESSNQSDSRSNSSEMEVQRHERKRSSSGEVPEDSSEKIVEKPAPRKPIEAPSKQTVEVKQAEREQEKAIPEKVAAPSQRKRKWTAKKTDDQPVIAITTDSLKTIISEEVKPVPLSDVKLLSSSPEPEPEEKRPRTKPTADDKDAKKKLLKERLRKQEEEEERRNEQLVKAIDKSQANGASSNGSALLKDRKVSIIVDDPAAPPSPPKNESSNILYITNLVRPFTVLQLKGLLARTGKIVENGFWIDKIKSKCYVKYETEE